MSGNLRVRPRPPVVATTSSRPPPPAAAAAIWRQMAPPRGVDVDPRDMPFQQLREYVNQLSKESDAKQVIIHKLQAELEEAKQVSRKKIAEMRSLTDKMDQR